MAKGQKLSTKLANSEKQNREHQAQIRMLQAQLAQARGEPAPPEDRNTRQSARLQAQLDAPEAPGVPPESVAVAPNVAARPNNQVQQAQNNATESDYMALVQRYGRKKKGKQQKNPDSDESCLMRGIRDAVKDFGGWKIKKFVTSPQALEAFAYKILDRCNIPELMGEDEATQALRKVWVDTNKHLVLKALNEQRNYAQGRIKDACEKYMEMESNEENKMPSLEVLEKIIKREIDPDNDEEWEAFGWYWTDLLPKAVGNGSDWCPDLCNYLTISAGAPPDSPNEPYVTPSTEAFAYIAISNNIVRWPALRNAKIQYGSDKTYICKVLKDKKVVTEDTVSGNFVPYLWWCVVYWGQILSHLPLCFAP